MFTYVVAVFLVFYIAMVFASYNIFRYLSINSDPFPYLNPKKYNLLPRVCKRGRTIISLTTVPGRIDDSKYAIASLLDQTFRVDEICMYVPYTSSKGVPYAIPTWMSELEKSCRVFKVKRCEKDWGPATKLIPALLEYKDCTIIYVDDDVIYNQNMIETLISYSNRFPNHAVCNQGWDVERWNGKSSQFAYTLHHASKYFPTTDPYNFVYTDVMQGFSGVLVSSEFFDRKEIVKLDEYPKEMFYVDDVYLSGMLNNQGINRISTLTQSGIPYLHEFVYGFLLRKAEHSLSSVHNADLVNDRIACSCFKWVKQVRRSIHKKP